MSTAGDWLREVGDVADELGWHVMEIRPGEIRLASKRVPDLQVTIISVFLSGKHLRDVLAKQEPKIA